MPPVVAFFIFDYVTTLPTRLSKRCFYPHTLRGGLAKGSQDLVHQ